ncbi:MAG: acyl-CoA/acyl-ACP dehydrogenase [Myxococcales bacterium]|nr:acyl-CoA/acyl-ACP dehydrogenase [Myxococcales bacterium]
MPSYLDALEKALPVITEHALAVDKEARFPKESLAALREAGLMGLISSTDVGGLGQGLRAAGEVIERIARECGSTAMVLCMHYCGAAVIEKHGSTESRKKASGEELSTLAFSEAGSRSHFWAPVSSATADGDDVVLDAHKSWVTSAENAATYVWSSQPLSAEGASTIWLVPRAAKGIAIKGPFEGLGLRGNDSSPVTAEKVRIPKANMLGEDGGGFGVMMETVLPIFNVMNAACTIGLMEGAVQRTIAHVSGTRYKHLDSALADLPTIRNYVARMRNKADMARTLWQDTIAAAEAGRADTMLRVLQVKATAGETATEVLDLAMRVCGGAAFRRDVGVERYFRDTRAGGIMAPTTDVLYDFIGKAVCGMDLF